MWQRPVEDVQEPSYKSAFKNTFATTYGRSYRDVNTIDDSPVYRERDFYQTPPLPDITYERRNYPYQDGYQENSPRYVDPREAQRNQYYDYNNEKVFRNIPPQTERWDHPEGRERGSERDLMKYHYNQMLARPEEQQMSAVTGKNACVACRGPEKLVAKCTNQLGCGHRYCDNCIRNLHATDGPFRDKTALYYYCGICKNSRTPAPKIVRFDPYGRRILRYQDVNNFKDYQ